jgi:hypothetical protein
MKEISSNTSRQPRKARQQAPPFSNNRRVRAEVPDYSGKADEDVDEVIDGLPPAKPPKPPHQEDDVIEPDVDEPAEAEAEPDNGDSGDVVEIDTTPENLEKVHLSLATITRTLGRMVEEQNKQKMRIDKLLGEVERGKEKQAMLEAQSVESGDIAVRKLGQILRNQLNLLIQNLNSAEQILDDGMKAQDVLVQGWDEAMNISWRRLLDASYKHHIHSRSIFQTLKTINYDIRALLDKIGLETQKYGE